MPGLAGRCCASDGCLWSESEQQVGHTDTGEIDIICFIYTQKTYEMHPPLHVEPGPGSLIYLYFSSLFLSFLKKNKYIYILYIYIYIYILILNIREGDRSEMSIYKGTRTWFHVIFVFIMLKMNVFFQTCEPIHVRQLHIPQCTAPFLCVCVR